MVAHGLKICERGPSFRRLLDATVTTNRCSSDLSDAAVEPLCRLALIGIDELDDDGVAEVERRVEHERPQRVGGDERLRRSEHRDYSRRMTSVHHVIPFARDSFGAQIVAKV